jgi:hypothetical protein
MRYLSVETKKLGERNLGRKDREVGRSFRVGGEVGEVGMEIEFIVSERGKRLEMRTKVIGLVLGYSFILVKVIGRAGGRANGYYDLFQILVANRFNSAYYLVLNTGNWSEWFDRYRG